MKDSSREFLEESSKYLKDLLLASISDLGEYKYTSDFETHNAIVDLYTIYTSYEIEDFNHIVDATNEFFDFLQHSKQYLNDIFVRKAVNRAHRIVNVSISKILNPNHTDSFAKTVLELSPSDPQKSHILDVGPGSVPYSSLELAKKTKKVSAMDKEFLFAIESLKSMNVFAEETYFGKDTPVDTYDFVVGRFPCSAIPYIVSKCKNQNKPYFLKLCECALYDKKVEILDDFAADGKYSWIEILPDLDPNIKFYEDYAFNIGSSVEQVRRVINSICGPSIKMIPSIPANQIIFSSEDIVSADCSGSSWSKE